MRVLPVHRIPEELWAANVLRLPKGAVSCYRDELAALGLLGEAEKGTDKKSIHGGCGIAETLEHFKYRFSVSAGRVEFTAIAPDPCLATVSDALLSDLADGHVTLLDIPCGSGSSAISLLATLGTLRATSVLPTLPLTVTIVGGDCSETALESYDSMMNRMRPLVSAYGIEINWQGLLWDATRADSTARLIDQWFVTGAGAAEYIVCIANFSGALTSAGVFDQFSPSLEQILGRLHDKRGALLWVEPTSPKVQTKFIPRILEFLSKRIAWFSSGTGGPAFTSVKYEMEDPLNGKTFGTGVEVQRFVRN
jgi:hypothetical protein